MISRMTKNAFAIVARLLMTLPRYRSDASSRGLMFITYLTIPYLALPYPVIELMHVYEESQHSLILDIIAFGFD